MLSRELPTISVSPAAGNLGTYIATFEAEVLDATYSVLFRESITGAIALHNFAEMLREHYGRAVKIELADGVYPLRNPAVKDILASIGEPGSQSMIAGT